MNPFYWPRQHLLALALVAIIGAALGTVVGYGLDVAARNTSNFGSWIEYHSDRLFWWSLFGAFSAGGVLYARHLLSIKIDAPKPPRQERTSSSQPLDERAKQARSNLLMMHLRKVKGGPALWRLNGTGLTLLGFLHDPMLSPRYFAMYWFTFLWIPIVPFCAYLVQSDGDRKYQIYGRLSLAAFCRIYRKRAAVLFFTSLAEGFVYLIFIVGVLILIQALFGGGRHHIFTRL